MTINWTFRARRNLREAATWIERDRPRAAAAWLRRVMSAVEQLERFPYSGRMIPELEIEHMRELIVGTYRVLYRTDDEGRAIDILAVVHASRLLSWEMVREGPEFLDRVAIWSGHRRIRESPATCEMRVSAGRVLDPDRPTV